MALLLCIAFVACVVDLGHHVGAACEARDGRRTIEPRAWVDFNLHDA